MTGATPRATGFSADRTSVFVALLLCHLIAERFDDTGVAGPFEVYLASMLHGASAQPQSVETALLAVQTERSP